jgi:WD40 repeat protein
MKERIAMKFRFAPLLLSLILALMLSACTLPTVTPPVADTQTPTSTFNTTPPITAPSQSTNLAPTVITPGNLASLDVANRVAVPNPQLLQWSKDSQSLAVANQTSDSSGNTLFGTTVLARSTLAPTYVYSTQGDRISDIAADGHTVALISQDQMSWSVVNLADNNTVLFISTPGFRIANVTFSSDLKYIAVTEAEQWEVILYNLSDGAEVRRLTGFETAAPIFDAGFSASQQWIIWHARATAQLQEVETGKLSPAFNHEDFLSAFTVSSDGSILATAAGKTVNGAFAPAVTLWDVVDGVEMHTLVLDNNAAALSFSPDGKLLAIAEGNDLQLWRVADGVLLGTFSEHQQPIALVKFSPDGKSIATAGFDNQLCLWQVLQ